MCRAFPGAVTASPPRSMPMAAFQARCVPLRLRVCSRHSQQALSATTTPSRQRGVASTPPSELLRHHRNTTPSRQRGALPQEAVWSLHQPAAAAGTAWVTLLDKQSGVCGVAGVHAWRGEHSGARAAGGEAHRLPGDAQSLRRRRRQRHPHVAHATRHPCPLPAGIVRPSGWELPDLHGTGGARIR